jgi:hypothetical protein
VRYYPNICLEGLRKTMNKLGILSVSIEIQIEEASAGIDDE